MKGAPENIRGRQHEMRRGSPIGCPYPFTRMTIEPGPLLPSGRAKRVQPRSLATLGVNEEAQEQHNAGHMKSITHSRPACILKALISSAGAQGPSVPPGDTHENFPLIGREGAVGIGNRIPNHVPSHIMKEG